MDVTPLINADSQVIQSYGPGRFKVSGTTYESALLVFPAKTLVWPVDAAALVPEDFSPFFHLTPQEQVDVILLGCGARSFMPPPAIKAALKTYNIALEVMDTGAACRTYNVLLADGRRVAAALLPL